MLSTSKYYKNSSLDTVASALTQAILLALKSGQSVLWLVSGGSTIDIAVKAAGTLSKYRVDKLNVSLVDERYGPVGHDNSNWNSLINAGFKLPLANLYPVLSNKNFLTTTVNHQEFIANQIENSFTIALLGMGADGHTAGILPQCQVINSDKLVDCYEAPDYRRITLTFRALSRLNQSVVFAAGESKKLAIENLSKKIALAEQPAQIFKQMSSVSIYNDYIG